MSFSGVFNPGNALPSEANREVADDRQAAREQNQGGLAEDNAATAPGKVCELCGSVITAGQDARLRVDGEWIHEACPIQ